MRPAAAGYLVSEEESSTDKGKGALFLLWAQALDSSPKLWGYTPKKIPENLKVVPGHIKQIFFSFLKAKETKAWMLASPELVHQMRRSGYGSPEAVAAWHQP